MLTLGLEAKDKITGLTGILTGRHQYISGCDRYTITPICDEKGFLQESCYFDECRIEIIGEGVAISNTNPSVGD
jgi:hypothetical protein